MIMNCIRRIINLIIRICRSPDLRKKIAILERKQEFPGRLRTAIDEAKEEDNLSPADFLSRIETKLADWLSENWNRSRIDESKGLNCDRDTEAEVELAIRFFPNVLSKKRNGRYLIFWQLSSLYGEYNLKAASFVPLFAKLAIELNQLTEEERGGLICDTSNLLRNLAETFRKGDGEEYHQLVDKTFLIVMKKLRDEGLFKKEDIRECDMIRNLCAQSILPEQRFRHLADWDPSCLMLPSDNDSSDRLPIQYATWYCKDIRGFRTVLEVRIHHFPKEMGDLFRRGGDCETVYQMACDRFGNEEVKKILNDGFRKNHDTNNTSTCSMLQSLVYAATEETVHLDGVFEVLRRDPSVLL